MTNSMTANGALLAGQAGQAIAPAGGSILADFLTLAEMAGELGVSTRTLGRWHNMRIGPPRTLLGNRVLYNKAAARAWVLAQAEHAAIRGAA